MSANDVAAALEESKPAAPGLKALAEARKHLGLKESPPGSNRTLFGRWFGADGEPWCAIFLSYCFNVGAGVVLCAGDDGPGCSALGCAYVPTIEAWLQSTGQWLEPYPPRAGDIAVFNWDGGEADHVGIVARRLDDGRFASIEGNTGFGDDTNGGQVLRRVRSLEDVAGFGRIKAARVFAELDPGYT
jgi:CHAP domain-containing protein